jgi:hypothetical protein
VGSVALVLGIQLLLLRGARCQVSEPILATVWAPGFEESAKALFLVALVVFRRHHLGGVLDGIVYAGIAGAGFAFTENVLYYAGAYSGSLAEDNPDVEEFDGAGATTLLFVVRGLFSPFAHSLFCVAFGIAVGLAVSTRLRGCVGSHRRSGCWHPWGCTPRGTARSPWWPWQLSVGLHARVHPAAAGRRRPGRCDAYARGRMLVRALRDAAARGWLHPDEIVWLSRFALRRRARSFAQLVGGPSAKQAVATYQELATRLAFAHDRVLTGHGGPRTACSRRHAAGADGPGAPVRRAPTARARWAGASIPLSGRPVEVS